MGIIPGVVRPLRRTASKLRRGEQATDPLDPFGLYGSQASAGGRGLLAMVPGGAVGLVVILALIWWVVL